MRATYLISALLMAGCIGGATPPGPGGDTPDAGIAATNPALLFPPRYLLPSGAPLPVASVCLDDGAPLLAQSRFATLAKRGSFPVAAAGEACDWRLSFAAAPPALDGTAAATWQAAGDHAERFVFVTTTTSPAVTVAFAADPLGARYAVDAAFAQFTGTQLQPATIVDWPALPMRGLVEGFYGPPFPDADRATLLGWLDEGRENTYVYGPQNDDYAHGLWYALYPDDQLMPLAHAADVAADAGIELVWAVRPGQGQFYPSDQPIAYGSDADFARLTAKIDQLRAAGIARFGLFFDDNLTTFTSADDMAMFPTLVAGQTFLINRLDDYLRGIDPAARLLVVGTDYSAVVTDWETYNQYLRDNLHPTVDVLWTGNQTYSPTISAGDLTPVGDSLGRQPIIWDNWPRTVVALNGRSTDLPTATPGLLSNPVLCSWQHHTAAQYAPILGTAAMYAWRPDTYDSTGALAKWQAAQAAAGGL